MLGAAIAWFVDVPQRVTGPTDVPRESRVVLLKDPEGDAGILVDRVQGVVRLPLSKLEPAPQLGLERRAVAGLGRADGNLYILLDVEAALARLQTDVQYRMFDNLAVGLGYNRLDVEADSARAGNSGRLRVKAGGPALFLRASF